MSDKVEWIQVNIFVTQGRQKDVLLGFIKPLVQKLRSDFKIIAYHFLYEPNNEIRFRVLTTPKKVDKIKELIDKAKTVEYVKELKYPKKRYQGEKQAFGEDGWKTTYKFLEAGSDFALDSLDKNVRKGPQFNLIAFSHYFLNQSGLGQVDEASFHASASIERMITWTLTTLNNRDKNINEKITQLETRTKALEEKRLFG